MKKYIVITITALLLQGCGYTGSLIIKDNEVIAKSNKPMSIEKKIDKEGVITYKYSSKKDSGVLGNIVTILSLGLIKNK